MSLRPGFPPPDPPPDYRGSGNEAHGLRFCASCGSLGYRDDRYCACCGSQLVRCCPHCNAQVLHPVAHYCTQCGGSLADETEEVVIGQAVIHANGSLLW